ncbi:MAG: hypothetical protein M1118_12860 [Chloroflexi bacterium]|nr:hypothetical protein [Chloroflexota bacterium]
MDRTDSLLPERARPNENVQRAMDYGSARAADQPAVHLTGAAGVTPSQRAVLTHYLSMAGA